MKKVVLIIGVAVLALGGAWLWLTMRGDDSEDTDNQQTGEIFAPVQTADLSFRGTLTGVAAGQSVNVSIEHESGGKSKATTYDAANGASEFFIDGDKAILCVNGGCISQPLGQTTFDTSSFSLGQEDVDQLAQKVTYQSTSECPTGTCQVWAGEDNGGVTTTIYVDQATNRISQITNKSAELDVKTVFEYVDVQVTIPDHVPAPAR